MRKFVLLTMTALLLAGCSGGGGVDDDYIADFESTWNQILTTLFPSSSVS